jgi:histidine ammonia-lyase
MIALLQAVDYLKAGERLSETTRKYYSILREMVPMFVDDNPMYKEIEKVKEYLFHADVDLPEGDKK